MIGNTDSVVGIVIRLPENNVGTVVRFQNAVKSSAPPPPPPIQWIRGPPFSEVNWPWLEDEHIKVELTGAVLLFPDMSSRPAQRQLYPYSHMLSYVHTLNIYVNCWQS
jgi:hypothetical protein